MKKFTKINESQQTYLNDGNKGEGFYINKYGEGVSIYTLNQRIKSYIDDVYGIFGFIYGENEDIEINGNVLNTEYISKMVNNYTVWKSFIRENRIKDAERFFEMITDSFDDVYNFKGDFFKNQTLPILINTTRKGNVGETKTLKKFKEVAKTKGLNITLIKPSVSEDIKGIDGKFVNNGRALTIQVKPLTGVEKKGNLFYAESTGSLSLGVNYLALYNDKNQFLILKNPDKLKIRIESKYFVYSIKHIVYSDF